MAQKPGNEICCQSTGNKVEPKMADVLSFSPIWCDVGKNLGTAYLVIGLKDCLERKLPFREKLRMIVNVRSQHVIFESFVNLDDAQENLTNQHVVLFPGK